MFGKIAAFARLTRIEHALLLALAVLTAETVALGRLPDAGIALLSILPPVLIEMASFAINDFFDVESDRLNKRFDRPLVSGAVSAGEALTLRIAAFAAGVAAAYFINATDFAIALAFAALAFAYSYRLKDVALLGNAAIAASMAIPFLFGNLAVAELSSAVLVLAAMAFLAGVAREIVITMRDVEGDAKARRARTLPMVVGVGRSAALASALFFAAIALSAYPFASIPAFKNDFVYLIPVLLADVAFAYVAFGILRNQSSAFLKSCRDVTLLAIALGLLGFFLGALA
jgi:geranylgeranylglycerol-phosphate geranylgeranyltransferase